MRVRRTSFPRSGCRRGGGFADMVALKGNKEIGDGINVVIRKLADANDFLLKGVIDQADFNDESRLGRGREMTDRLTKLVGIFERLDLRANRAQGDDLLGDAYEYLMRHFATQSGKSKGQFYTPAEVSRIMAQVVGIGPDTGLDRAVYDPTCGSGSLLIKATDEAPNGLTIYGQEMDVATWTMACMNMILHGNVDAEIERGNALAGPRFTDSPRRLKRFDFRGRQSPVLHQSVGEWLRSGPRRVPPLRVRHPARKERRLRLLAPSRRFAQEHGEGRDHPPARGTLPRQPRGPHPPQSRQARTDPGRHRVARQPLLRHRNPRVHRRGRQRRTRPPARASSWWTPAGASGRTEPRTVFASATFTASSMCSTTSATRPATLGWCRSTRSPAKPTITT